MAVLIIAFAAVFFISSILGVCCCLQKRRKQPSPLNIDVQKALMDQKPPTSAEHQRPNYRTNDNLKIVVNQMDDLLNHNTHTLQQAGSPHSCKKSAYFCSSFEENTYEVPHVLPANLRIDRPGYTDRTDRTGYYDARDVIRPTYFTSVRS